MKKVILYPSLIILGLGLVIIFLIYYGYLWLNHPGAEKFPFQGIDISAHQKNIDWKEVPKNPIHFVYIKATEGKDFKDQCFLENWKNAKEIGLIRGAYHFFTFRSSGKEQAQNFIDTVPFEKDSLPPVIDIEFGGNSKAIPTRAVFRSELNDFIAAVWVHYHKKPILYVTYAAYDKYILGHYYDCKLWIRDIVKYPKLSDNRDWILWQYSSRGRMKGFHTFVDINVFKGKRQDFEALLESYE